MCVCVCVLYFFTFILFHISFFSKVDSGVAKAVIGCAGLPQYVESYRMATSVTNSGSSTPLIQFLVALAILTDTS